MEEKNTATLIAVGGVVALGIGLLIYYAVSGYVLESKPIELIVTGLLGFAGGVGTLTLKDKL